jgi:hypothetical protein
MVLLFVTACASETEVGIVLNWRLERETREIITCRAAQTPTVTWRLHNGSEVVVEETLPCEDGTTHYLVPEGDYVISGDLRDVDGFFVNGCSPGFKNPIVLGASDVETCVFRVIE